MLALRIRLREGSSKWWTKDSRKIQELRNPLKKRTRRLPKERSSKKETLNQAKEARDTKEDNFIYFIILLFLI